MQPQSASEAATPSGNVFNGLHAIFYSPGDAFQRSGKLTWAVPLIAALLLIVAITAVVVNMIGMVELTRMQIEMNTKMAEQLGPAKIAEIAQQSDTPARKGMAYAGGAISVLVVLLISSGITYGLLLMMGGNTKFTSVLAADAWATYAVSFVALIATVVVLSAVADRSSLDLQNLVMLNAGAFMSHETSKVVRALASGIDLLGFWAIFLKSLGIVKLSERLSMKTAVTASVVVYILGILVKAGFAAMF